MAHCMPDKIVADKLVASISRFFVAARPLPESYDPAALPSFKVLDSIVSFTCFIKNQL